jgi:ParB/RepB/Spo0J family partition protein
MATQLKEENEPQAESQQNLRPDDEPTCDSQEEGGSQDPTSSTDAGPSDMEGQPHQAQQDGVHEDQPADDRSGECAPAPAAPEEANQSSQGELETLCRFLDGSFLTQACALLQGDYAALQAALPSEVPSSDGKSPPCAGPELFRKNGMDLGDPEAVRRLLTVKFPPEMPAAFSATAPAAPDPVQVDPGQPTRFQARLGKRRTELHHGFEERRYGPQGEARSEALTTRVEMIGLDKIVDDPRFENFRLKRNPEKIQELAGSMEHEGLKSLITVIEAPGGKGEFYLRAGFNRTAAARSLNWKEIPAVILPVNTPEIEERWANLLENSVRSDLTTYETANAAKIMRDRHGVSAKVFGKMIGRSESHVSNLLRCRERLPLEILDQWREGPAPPFDLLTRWSTMHQQEALEEFRRVVGQRCRMPKDFVPPPRKRMRNLPVKIASEHGFKRMHRLRSAIQEAPKFDESTKATWLQIVDYCMGGRETVTGVLDGKTKKRNRKARGKD